MERLRKPTTPGPDPEVLRIEGDWTDAVRKALRKRVEPKRPSRSSSRA